MSSFTRPPAASTEILTALLAAFPKSISSVTLIAEHGPAAKSRIGDLRAAGWVIGSSMGIDGAAEYSLVSTRRGPANIIFAGLTIRHSSKAGWEARTHGESTLPENVLDEAKAAALVEYSRVVNEYMKSNSKDSAMDILDFLGL